MKFPDSPGHDVENVERCTCFETTSFRTVDISIPLVWWTILTASALGSSSPIQRC